VCGGCFLHILNFNLDLNLADLVFGPYITPGTPTICRLVTKQVSCLGTVVVANDSGAEGRGFESMPGFWN
jgi:hypothetical protein